MTFTHIVKSVEKALRDNSTTILTALGVSGTITTAYLTAKASFKAVKIIEASDCEDWTTNPREQLWFRTKLVWKEYIPAGVTGVTTIACIIGGAAVGAKRTATAYSLAAVSEKAFDEYRAKVVEKLGETKERNIRNEVAQDRVTKAPAPMIVTGANQVLCFEAHTGRYFNSDMETLRKAQNEINAQALRENEATLNDFYYLIGLETTAYSGGLGWTSDRLLDISFTTVISPDNRPCIAFSYNYLKQL